LRGTSGNLHEIAHKTNAPAARWLPARRDHRLGGDLARPGADLAPTWRVSPLNLHKIRRRNGFLPTALTI